MARPEALSQWALGHDSPLSLDPVAHWQKTWDHPRLCATAQALTDEAQDARSQVGLLAACSSESGAWLQALPSPSLGLQMDDKTVQVAVGLRLGTPLCRPCSHCGSEVDALGTHGLSCRWSKGTHTTLLWMTSFTDPWRQPTFHLDSSPQGYTGPTGGVLMAAPFFHGGVVKYWFGTPLAQTPMLPHMSQLLQEGQALWLLRLSTRRKLDSWEWPFCMLVLPCMTSFLQFGVVCSKKYKERFWKQSLWRAAISLLWDCALQSVVICSLRKLNLVNGAPSLDALRLVTCLLNVALRRAQMARG